MDMPKELKTLLSCSVCGRNYDLMILLPRMLDCKHVYCVDCIDGRLVKTQMGNRVICPQCKQPTTVGPYPESLVFLIKQMPALKLGRAMIKNYHETHAETNQEDQSGGSSGRTNWMDSISVENFLMNSSREHCPIHIMPNTVWCHNCQLLMCEGCAEIEFHLGHRFTRQLDFNELLRQIFSNEMTRIGNITDQATQIAAREMTLWQQLCEACSMVQLHIKREMLEHNPTLVACQMRGWRQQTERDLLLSNGHFPTNEMVRLLGQLNEQKRKYQYQLNEIQHQCRLKSVIYENGMELLDFNRLNERVLELRDGGNSNAIPLNVEPPPALLLTNYCIYSYWKELQTQFLPTVQMNQNREQNELLPQARQAVAPPHFNQSRPEYEPMRQLMMEQQHIVRQLRQHTRYYTYWDEFDAYHLSGESSPSTSSSSSSSCSNLNNYKTVELNAHLKQRTTQRYWNSPYWAYEMEQAMAANRKSSPPNEDEPCTSAAAAAAAAATRVDPSPVAVGEIDASVPEIDDDVAIASTEENGIVPLLSSKPNPLQTFPIYYLDMEIDGKLAGRILIVVHDDVAPRMAKNFRFLILHERGFGYRGCSIFQAWNNESIITGDFQCHNGRGGYSALEKGTFFKPDETQLAPRRGAVGMRRGQRLSDSNKYVGSQFRLIVTEIRAFSAIFGYIIEGIDVVDRIAKTGDQIGRPEVRTVIKDCGIYRRE